HLRRRSGVPHQGLVHATGALPPDGTPSRCMARRPPPLGSPSEAQERAVDPLARRPAMKMVVLGATKGMGRALARAAAERGDRVFLLGRDAQDLEKSARDLDVHAGQGSVGTAICDLAKPDTFAPALAAAERALGGFDTVVITAGLFATQEKLEDDLAFTR